MKKVYLKLSLILLLLGVLSIYVQPVNAYADTSKAVTVVAKRSKKAKKKIETIETKKQFMDSIVKHVINLDKNIKFKINRKAIKNTYKEFNKIFDDLSENMKFNEIMSNTSSQNTLTSDEGGRYFEFTLKLKYDIDKAEAKKTLSNISPIVKTKEELIRSMVEHTENLDEEFSINIANSVSIDKNEDEYDKLWDSLYAIPEFNDIKRYSKGFKSNFYYYKKYYKWKISIKYDLVKEEVNSLNDFIRNWVVENIKPEMTEEEKVRAINDFMVREYRYTYGDNVQPPTDNLSCPDGKLGKYSVYTSFALLYGKGGVCDAKAKMFYRLAKEAGLSVIYITGNIIPDRLHAWNMVKVDGNWYHLDNTWNRGHYEGSGEYDYFARRDYYLKSDASMSKDHSWDRTKYPAANTDYPLGPEHALPEDTDNLYNTFSLNKAS